MVYILNKKNIPAIEKLEIISQRDHKIKAGDSEQF